MKMAGIEQILYRGSVKDIRGVEGKSPYIFEFSDRYSIFDWGEMPDQLKGKGEALAFMAWFFFDYLGNPKNWADWKAPAGFEVVPALRRLREKGMAHHMIGLVSHDMKTLSLEREIMAPSRNLAVHPVAVLRPPVLEKDKKIVWDYSAYQARPKNALVPLEVIFRFGIPEGSSLLKRTGDVSYCRDIGLLAPPAAGERFEVPIVEFSTKLENKDRYLKYTEAAQIAGLVPAEFENLKELAALTALRLKDCFAQIDIELWDGKLEFAFGDEEKNGIRNFMLVDSIGPDELRLTHGGVQLSKENLRGFYRPTAWCANVDKAKALGDARGDKDWRKICTDELDSRPPLLSPAVKQKAEMIYKGLAKALSQKFYGQPVFKEAWDLSAVADSFAAKDNGKKEVA